MPVSSRESGAREFGAPVLYQSGTWGRIVWCAALLFLVLWFSILLRSSSSAAPIVGLSAVGVVLAVGWSRNTTRRVGLRFESDAVVLVRYFGRDRLALDEIDRCELGKDRQASTVVRVVTRTGRGLKAPGIILGDRGPFRSSEVCWPGGASRHIIERLTDHLAWLRAHA